jgi:serine/threonine-protein kinase
MASFPDDSRSERLLGLALAKGWIRRDQLGSGGWASLLESGLLAPAQAEALERELDRGQAFLGHAPPEGEALTAFERPEGTAPHPTSSGGSGSSLFSASWIRAWAHYEDLVLLAEGGMGRIFKARDTRLRRKVALKMLRREDPELQARFLREAEWQARISHPHVCRIYEAGEWRGQAYIAMELIEGDTFKAAARGMDRAEILRLMVEVCEGVHAAHREGLIHRDLKPANLMVATEEEPPRAVVLDFGLARPAQPTGLTASGFVMGTVHYMSPEQARGQDRGLDRRTDVYALGVTLYELLAGDPPFHELHGLEVIAKILSEEPPALAKVARVPRDLDTVVMKCLEKEPARRYDSARALGDELQRVLEGEPILARAVSRRERLMRWARKNRTLVAVGAAGLLATGIFSGVALRERLRARARAEYAQRFGQEAERIEALARYLKLAPPHDLRLEQGETEARVRALAAEVQQERSLAEGPGAFALGRARLALGDAEGARRLLERAQALGFDTPELRFALGRALMELHQRDLEATWRLGQEEARREALARLKARAEERIVPLLRAGAARTLVPVAFLEGQVALVSGRSDKALRLAREAFRSAPWFFEAKVLEAQSLLGLGLEQEPKARLESLAQAQAAADTALLMAPSDEGVAALAGRIAVIRYGLVPGDAASGEAFGREVHAALARLEALHPGGESGRLLRASFLTARAVTAQVRGRSGAEEIRTALALLKPLVEAPQPTWEAQRAAMVAACYAAKFPELGEPVAWLDQALEQGRRAVRQRPEDAELAQEFARAAVWRMSEGTARGEAPWAVFETALEVVRQALAGSPDSRLLQEALGFLWGERAEFERTHGLDPRYALDHSIEAFRAAMVRGPSFRAWYGIGNAALMRGQYELERHLGDPRGAFQEAERGYREARALAPYHAGTPANLVEVAVWRARASGAATVEGRQALKEGEAVFEEATVRFPKVGTLWLRGAQLAALEGDLGRARERIRRAQTLDPHSVEVRSTAAELAVGKGQG